jgi:hypothetical protein
MLVTTASRIRALVVALRSLRAVDRCAFNVYLCAFDRSSFDRSFFNRSSFNGWEAGRE